MGMSMSLVRFPKGTIKELTPIAEVDKSVLSIGSGCNFTVRSLICNWFVHNLESVERFWEQYNLSPCGLLTYAYHTVEKNEYDRALKEAHDLLQLKEMMDKKVDEAVGDNTLYGRSELRASEMMDVCLELMSYIPKTWQLNSIQIEDWHVPGLRDFWWLYWDDIKKMIEALEGIKKEINWDKEDLFFILY